MKPWGNRRRKNHQKITKQLVLEVTKSLWRRIKSQKQWQNFVTEAIIEKLTKLENSAQLPSGEKHFQKILEGTPMPIIIFQISEETQLAITTLQSIGEGVISTNALSQIQDCNPAAERLLGWTIKEIKGQLLSEVFRLIDEATRQPVENPIDKVLEQGQIIRLENSVLLLARTGAEYAVNITASPIRSRENQLMGVVLVISDHTQSRQLARQLSWQASHDPLTELVNRQAFEQRVEDALKESKTHNIIHTLGYLDLDKFKIINDTCGHVAGDDLLRKISALFQKKIRSTDTIARLGGDEFGLLLLNCTIEKGEEIAENLRQSVEDFRFSWEQQIFSLGVSIGLVPIHAESADVTTLLDTADTACYAAKTQGRNQIHTFRTDEQELNRQRQARHWVTHLNQALEDNHFCLYMQKIAPITPDSGAVHYEVLLRLTDKQGNLFLPGDFLPVAERYHLMPNIDQWVIENFFNHYEQYYQITSSQISQENQICYNLNLSAASLNNDGFFTFLKQQLNRPYIRPQFICFEITESNAIGNLSQTKQLINIIKQLGCRFALDDVGTGINSLSYLKNISIDYLKINGSLIQNMLIDPVDYTFVECFNRIGHSLGMQTIAECVEHQSVLEPLRTIGVDYVQGYAISRPVPLSFTII